MNYKPQRPLLPLGLCCGACQAPTVKAKVQQRPSYLLSREQSGAAARKHLAYPGWPKMNGRVDLRVPEEEIHLKRGPSDNLLGISWVDSSWIPILNNVTVLDYFSERSNPFYDRTCSNEVVKMQRLTMDHLSQMTGVEYILLHAQEPILFIIRKQQRQSPTQVIPLADYYIIAGVIYQAPDLGSVINSRVLSAVHGIQSAFDEAMSYCRYHPSKGYWWHFKDQEERDKAKPKSKKKEEASSFFQRQRVDSLLLDLRQKFPPKFVQQKAGEKPIAVDQIKKEPEQAPEAIKQEDKEAPKSTQQSSGPKAPPEKRMRVQ